MVCEGRRTSEGGCRSESFSGTVKRGIVLRWEGKGRVWSWDRIVSFETGRESESRERGDNTEWSAKTWEGLSVVEPRILA